MVGEMRESARGVQHGQKGTVMATMADVARRAGVSTATVSHVINNSRYVSDETQNKVLAAIVALNYRSNGLARMLRRNQSGSIGLLISDIANPFFPDVVRGVEDMARAHGYNVILCNTDENATKERHYLDVLLEKRIDGFVVTPSGDNQQYFRELIASGVPISFVDRWLPGLNVDTAVVDNVEAAHRAVTHLIDLGHRRIGIMVASLQSSAITERLDGYRQALSDAGIPFRPEYVAASQSNIEAAREEAALLLTQAPRPTAVFGTNNLVTIGCIHALAGRQLRCPEDVAVIGFDDFAWASAFHPALTTVAQPSYALGKRATEMLMARLTHKQNTPIVPHKETLRATLMIRESCGSGLGIRTPA